MNAPLKATILVVEDDPGIAELEKDRLMEAGYEILVAGTADEAIAHLGRQRVDLILLDYRLPGAENGLDFYARVKKAGFDPPVILVTGFGSETTVIQALRVGVRDFVTKSIEYLDYLPDAVGRVLRQVQTEHRLAESEARLGAVIESAIDAVIVTEANRRVSLFNPAAERMFRCPAAEALGRRITDFIPDELVADSPVLDGNEVAMQSHRLRPGTIGVRVDGEEFPLEASVSRGEANGRRFYTIVARDVTERERDREFLRATLECLQTGVVACDKDGRLVLFNRAAAEFHGRSAEPIRSDRWAKEYDLFQADGITEMSAEEVPLHRAMRGELVRDVEMVIAPKERRRTAVLVSGQPIVASDGRQLGAVAAMQDITARRQAEVKIREQAALLDLAHDAIIAEDMNGQIQFWNQGAARLYGWRADEVLGRPADSLFCHNSLAGRREGLRQVFADGQWTGEMRQFTKLGNEIVVHCSWSLIRDATGMPTGVLRICTDVTEQRKIEEQFRHAQKMEVFGRLAAGVAHDFNNLLTVINGYSELILAQLPASDTLRESVGEISQAGARAAGLTRQLLAFSRQQVLEPKVLNLNEVVQGIAKMLQRLIGEDLTVETALSPALGKVKADPGQLEQVLTNLAVNARDAMPRQGRLTIETANAELDEAYCRMHPEASPGRYVQLAVADTGCGMTEAVKERVFEPFFTTKEVGKGTGLGLATVFGIVKQSGGHVAVYSEVGKGTTFKIYLPRIEEEFTPVGKSIPNAKTASQGSETILLVEDEPALRSLALHALESKGYTVLPAADGEEALRICQAHEGAIDLLVSDVVMPRLGGRELAEQIIVLRPRIRVLFLSGYTSDAVVRHGVLEAEVAFLQKPFTVDGLTQKTREVLDG